MKLKHYATILVAFGSTLITSLSVANDRTTSENKPCSPCGEIPPQPAATGSTRSGNVYFPNHENDYGYSPEWSPVQFGIVSRYQVFNNSTDVTGLRVGLLSTWTDHSKGLSISPLYNWSERHQGIELALISNTSEQNTSESVKNSSGISIAGLLNNNDDGHDGLQVAGLHNRGEQDHGIKIAGLSNFSESNQGAQISILSNLTDDGSTGFQAALFNINTDNYWGLQIGGVSNYSETLSGVQLSGLTNVAEEAVGIQMSGIINFTEENYSNSNLYQFAGVANVVDDESQGSMISVLHNKTDDFSGFQLSIFNKSDSTKGVQIGLLNDAEELNGVQIGLFNFSKGKLRLPLLNIF